MEQLQLPEDTSALRPDYPQEKDSLKPARLLLISCSHRKIAADGPIPAIERYDGPAFRVIRRFRKEHLELMPDILILSAKYGLIESHHLIDDYDERMTPERAAELRKGVETALRRRIIHYKEALVSLSGGYQLAVPGIALNPPAGTSVEVLQRRQGERLARLRDWLYQLPYSGPRPAPSYARTGTARLKGLVKSIGPEQLLDEALHWLEEDRGNAQRSPFRLIEWYVELNGERVGIKWLTGRLFDLPTSSFDSSDARRILLQLGVPVRHTGGQEREQLH